MTREQFKQTLSDKCKDMGLTDKAIEELVNLGFEGITEETSDEDVAKKVDSIVPFAKAMQGEITRKMQKKAEPITQPKTSDEIPDWAKTMMEKVDALSKENAELKASSERKARSEQITAKAKELGIPEYLMKRMSIADDADFVKELTDFKQDLVNAKLMPESTAGELGSSDQQLQEDAKSWVEGLPNK